MLILLLTEFALIGVFFLGEQVVEHCDATASFLDFNEELALGLLVFSAQDC